MRSLARLSQMTICFGEWPVAMRDSTRAATTAGRTGWRGRESWRPSCRAPGERPNRSRAEHPALGGEGGVPARSALMALWAEHLQHVDLPRVHRLIRSDSGSVGASRQVLPQSGLDGGNRCEHGCSPFGVVWAGSTWARLAPALSSKSGLIRYFPRMVRNSTGPPGGAGR